MPVNFSLSQSMEATIHTPNHAMGILRGVGRSRSVGDPTAGGIDRAVAGGINSNKQPTLNAKGWVFYIDLYLTGTFAQNDPNKPYNVALILFEGRYYRIWAFSDGNSSHGYLVDKVQLVSEKQVAAILSKLYQNVAARTPAVVPVPVNPSAPGHPGQLRLPTLPGGGDSEIYAAV